MSDPESPAGSDAALEAFRRQFHSDRKAFVLDFGPESYDWAQVLYRCAKSGRQVVIKDVFYGNPLRGTAGAALEGLKSHWWASRSRFVDPADETAEFTAVAGLYGHYLPEVGFDYSVELNAEGIACCWRMNSRGKVNRLPVPTSDLDFRDQTGTFLDVRQGWGALMAAHEEEDTLMIAEVQTGYLIGARAGVPGHPDPASREDPELETVFSRWDPRDYDTLEFLAGPVADAYPFYSERFDEWLDPIDVASLKAGEVEIFVLADASSFLACIEDLAGKRGIAVEWVDPDDDLKVAFHLGGLRVQLDFSYPYLRTLHTGRSFVGGARTFFGPALETLDEGNALLTWLRGQFEGFEVDIEADGVTMNVSRLGESVGRWNVLMLAERTDFRGQEGQRNVLAFMGFDAASGRFIKRVRSLEACPVCGSAARVGKVVRHTDSMGIDGRALVSVSMPPHIAYYTQECTHHSSPVEATWGWSLGDLEAAYQDGLEHAVATLVTAKSIGEALLLVGHDVGSMALEPARLKAALEATDFKADGWDEAHAFFPDALVLSGGTLDPGALESARIAALEAVLAHFPTRATALDITRTVDLSVAPLGTVEWSA